MTLNNTTFTTHLLTDGQTFILFLNNQLKFNTKLTKHVIINIRKDNTSNFS